LLYVGNILKAKGVSTLINATKHIGIRTYIIGDGEDRAEFEKMKNEDSLDNIIFLGKKDKSEVIKYLTDALLVIVPSEWYENLPYSLVEALLMAKPVLGANIGGIPELIIDGETGFLFEPGNVESLKQKLHLILSLPPKDLGKIGKMARDFIKEKISFDKYGSELSPLFATLGLKLEK
ncbi:MAG: glycosyltransferase, partial [Flavobacterium sp.]